MGRVERGREERSDDRTWIAAEGHLVHLLMEGAGPGCSVTIEKVVPGLYACEVQDAEGYVTRFFHSVIPSGDL